MYFVGMAAVPRSGLFAPDVRGRYIVVGKKIRYLPVQ